MENQVPNHPSHKIVFFMLFQSPECLFFNFHNDNSGIQINNFVTIIHNAAVTFGSSRNPFLISVMLKAFKGTF